MFGDQDWAAAPEVPPRLERRAWRGLWLGEMRSHVLRRTLVLRADELEQFRVEHHPGVGRRRPRLGVTSNRYFSNLAADVGLDKVPTTPEAREIQAERTTGLLGYEGGCALPAARRAEDQLGAGAIQGEPDLAYAPAGTHPLPSPEPRHG